MEKWKTRLEIWSNAEKNSTTRILPIRDSGVFLTAKTERLLNGRAWEKRYQKHALLVFRPLESIAGESYDFERDEQNNCTSK